jgi:large subunit ribosomal protein L31e
MAKKKGQEESVEKHFVVSFSKLYNAPRQKRAYRAIRHLKRFAFKHLRISEENVSVSRALNEALWARGREHIPRKIEIKVVKDKEKAGVYLKGEKVEKPKKEKEKKAKEEKKPEKKEEKEREEEIERKKEEKKAKEKAAEATAIKRGTGKGK